MFTLTLITALGCGLIAGIFFAFSSFVMKALGNLPPAQGIAAMQRINIDVINPSFMAVFMGTAALSMVLAVWTLLDLQAPGALYRLTGAALYLLGTFAITILFNVPLNNRLAKISPETPGSPAPPKLTTFSRTQSVKGQGRTMLPDIVQVGE